jgi:hypothetical protein
LARIDLDDPGPWNEYRRLVMDSLGGIDERLSAIEARLNDLQTSVTVLKVKVGLWSALGGSIGGAIVGAVVAKLVR